LQFGATLDKDERNAHNQSRMLGPGVGPVAGNPPAAKPQVPESSMPSQGLLYLALAISVVLAALCFFVYLLKLGDRGNWITGPSSLLVAILALVCTLVIWLYDRGHIRLRVQRQVWIALRGVALLILIGLLLAGAASLYFVVRRPDLHITEDMDVVGGHAMAGGSDARLIVPDPTRRDQLAFIPELTNRESTGNCVGSATLDVRLVADGVLREVSKGRRPGEEISIPLKMVSNTAIVFVTVHMRDPACRVDLVVGEAILFSGKKR
jgi:hypothetical protein